MEPIETTGTDIDPAWSSFGINRVDFRPHWDGDLVNLFSAVGPLESETATEQLMTECVRAIAGWVASHRDRFGSEDRFQIIVGWPKHVRETGRQAIKVGGTLEDMEKLATGSVPLEMRRGWSSGIFQIPHKRRIAFLKRSIDELRSTPDDFDFPEDELENEVSEQAGRGDGGKPSN